MPIRLTVSYGERLANERFESRSQLKKDVVSLCAFWKALREVDAANVQLQRSQFLRIAQERKSASDRLLTNGTIITCASLQPHEKFELAFLVAIVAACVVSFEAGLGTFNKRRAANGNVANDQKEVRAEHKLLTEKLDELSNTQIIYLLGSNPDEYVKPFLQEAGAVTFAILREKQLEPDDGHHFIHRATEAAIDQFKVWLSSNSDAAKWISPGTISPIA